MIRAVLDTNVLVSAAITPKGHSDQILAQAEAGTFSLLTSEFILTELADVLGRKHIQTKYRSQVTTRKRMRYLSTIREFAEVVQVKSVVSAVPEDPKDNKILACGKDAQADYAVSGDPHLRRLGTFEGIQMVTPAEFLEILAKQ
jgi:uncharacterized protein